jgi:hypothetical protein
MILRGAPSSGVPAERGRLPGGDPSAEIVFPPTFPLLLDSTPDGADVYEGDRRIGATPLRLVLENTALNAHPRRFRIERRGFRTLFVTQGPSTDPVRIVAGLVPEQVSSTQESPQEARPQPLPGKRGARERPPVESGARDPSGREKVLQPNR